MPTSMRSRTAILRSIEFLRHDTGDHPERASRMIAIDFELERRRLLSSRPSIACTMATDADLLLVHSPEMLELLESVAAAGGGWIDADTVVRPESPSVARLAAGGAVNAVDAILDGQIDRAFLIARPPGHHATANRSMGFCLTNTIAVAAAHAIDRGLERVAILDWDVHHGNGTQDIFYGRSDVLFCSIHQFPFYPGTGSSAETGHGEGEGFTVNVPVPAGTRDADFIDLIRSRLITAIDRFAPQLLLVSAGYDGHASDPIGGLQLSDAAYGDAMREAVKLANRHCDGRLLVVLEGGYDGRTLARLVADGIAILDHGARHLLAEG